MLWILTPGAGVLFAAFALSLVLAGLAWRRSALPQWHYFPLLMLAVAGWCLVSGLEASFVPFAWRIFWAKLEYLGSGSAATLLLLFAARYSGHDRWLRGSRQLVLWSLPAVGVGLAGTNELHHIVWTGFSPGPVGTNFLIYHHGPGYSAIVCWIYAYLFCACGLLVKSALRPATGRRRQVTMILLAAAFPLTAGILYSLGYSVVPGLNLVPMSFVLTAVVLLVGMGLFRVLDLVPIARDTLVERMPDGVIVVDARRRIVDANAAAANFLGVRSPLAGRDIGRTLEAWCELNFASPSGEERHVEITLSREPLLHVDVRMTPLYEPGQREAGCLIVMRDITTRYEAETKLREANERLEADVRRIEALQTELKDQAIRDGLTGLFNRRYLDEILPRELARAAHEGTVLSVVMIDIDHFKATNDQRGHREGDRLLTLLGALLRERTRPGDVACRYGGEEFLFVLPGASSDVALARMDDVRAAYSTRLTAAGFDSPPTLSAGVASYPVHAQSDDDLLRAADDALYQAKAAGRDRVCIAGDATPGS
jgi:diguanylate cyclase (GGDEF)-like protein/PAS domain S-box-containing protein